jgi:hypothetical protein
MARGRKGKPWEPTFRRIQVISRADWFYPPRPTAADLAAAEALLACRFPASYRAFAEEFGLGGKMHTLPRLYHLVRPPWANRWSSSVVDDTRELRANPEEGEADLCSRAVVFGADPGYNTFLFDVGDVTDSHWREYHIWQIRRDGSAEAIADSFPGWLAWIDEHYRFEEDSAEDDRSYPQVLKPNSSDPSLIPYQRYFVRGKNGPQEEQVRAWLVWNHGAVREIARSIREEGRADTFPILADALEEAGCTNEDLLFSCRAGDPDIDGAWALAVLLGAPRRSSDPEGLP